MFKNFMLMEYLLHNPIVHTFVHILSDKSRSRGFKNLSYGTYAVYACVVIILNQIWVSVMIVKSLIGSHVKHTIVGLWHTL